MQFGAKRFCKDNGCNNDVMGYMYDNYHYHLEEDGRQTTTGEMTALREGSTMTTRETAITTTAQDRAQEMRKRSE